MILSRIARALREQNWLAVGLEFVIVIAGIVIGFQVTAWNAARTDRALEREYVQRILTDIESSRALQDTTTAGAADELERARSLAMAIRAQSLDGLTEVELQHGLSRLGGWYEVAFIDATLDELYATGQLSLIRSQNLREALTVTRRQLEIAEAANANIGSMMLDHYIVLADNLTHGWVEGENVITASTDEVFGNSLVASRVDQMALGYGYLHQIQLGINEQTEALRAALLEEYDGLETSEITE